MTSDDDHGGAGLSGLAHSQSTAEVIARYDGWVGSYNEDLQSWGYEVPQTLASELADHLSKTPGASSRTQSQPILDAGCGTGLVGVELAKVGLGPLLGIDGSQESLAAAGATGVYERLNQGDLLATLAFEDEAFSAVVCGGVLTYLPDTERVLRELVRVTQAGGVVLATQRTDLWVERNCDEVMASLDRTPGLNVSWTEPRAYLPGHPEYGESIRVVYITITVGDLAG